MTFRFQEYKETRQYVSNEHPLGAGTVLGSKNRKIQKAQLLYWMNAQAGQGDRQVINNYSAMCSMQKLKSAQVAIQIERLDISPDG